ncbi:hypothetical protein WH47_03263, partial [Habropoda laboriosa]
ILSRGSFRNDPSKRRNWKLSNRTERQSRSAGARGEEESSTRARPLITGTAPETGDGKSRRGIREKKACRKQRERRRDGIVTRARGPSVRVLGVCSLGRGVALDSFKVGKPRKE